MDVFGWSFPLENYIEYFSQKIRTRYNIGNTYKLQKKSQPDCFILSQPRSNCKVYIIGTFSMISHPQWAKTRKKSPISRTKFNTLRETVTFILRINELFFWFELIVCTSMILNRMSIDVSQKWQPFTSCNQDGAIMIKIYCRHTT